MINLILGVPGSGKSYEAVVFHILPALQSGRLVVTNLPLNLDRLAAIDPAFPACVRMVDKTCAVAAPSTPVIGRFGLSLGPSHNPKIRLAMLKTTVTNGDTLKAASDRFT